MINWALLRPYNLFVVGGLTLAAMFLFAQAKNALDNGSSDNT